MASSSRQNNRSRRSDVVGNYVPDDMTPQEVEELYNTINTFDEDLPSSDEGERNDVHPPTTEEEEENAEAAAPSRATRGGRGRRGGRGGRGRDGDQMPPPPKKASSLNSPIFTKHFFMKKIDGEDRAQCRYCDKHYAHGGNNTGYGTLNTHMKNKHPSEWGNASSQSQLNFASSSTGTRGTSSNTSSLFSYTDANHRKFLSRFVSVMGLPFNFAGNCHYEDYTKGAFNPCSTQVSRNKVTRDIGNVVGEYKYNLGDMFNKLPHSVSICADIWTDCHHEHNYIGITCHWIDSSWILNKRLIAFSGFDIQHTAQNIAHKISGILAEYNLTFKIFSISFDNASANTASIEALKQFCEPACGGKFFHVRCVCHILNLCVQDGLGTFKAVMYPIKRACNLIYRNDTVSKQWRRHCRGLGIHPKKISNDVPNRWNSTYRLLNESFEYKDALLSFFHTKHTEYGLLSHMWDDCFHMMNLLKTFNDATVALSGVYYPTSPLLVDVAIQIVLFSTSLLDSPQLGGCVRLMLTKWVKYFLRIPDAFLIAKILDPDYRVEGLENLLTVYYDALRPFLENEGLEVPSAFFCAKLAKNDLYNLFSEYNSHATHDHTTSTSTTEPQPSPVPNYRTSSSSRGLLDPQRVLEPYTRLIEDTKRKRQRASASRAVELETYLGSFESENIPKRPDGTNDLIQFWSRMENVFPTLSRIAKEILAIPVSTVSVEQAFSTGGFVLDDRRSNLHPTNLENQMLLNDWVKADRRKQELEVDEAEESDHYDRGSTSDE